MICSCSKKKSSTSRRKTIQKSDLVKLRQAFRFTENEILELRSRFDSLLPPGANTINKDTFCDKMGVLGIDAGRFLSNRIFEVIDNNQDGEVDFLEFLKYLDVLVNGEQEEKAVLTFYMIDNQRKGWFSYSEFSQLVLSILQAWSAIMSTQLSISNNSLLRNQINLIYRKFDVTNTGKVTLQIFKEAVLKEPYLLEIFDYASKGFHDSINPFIDLPPKLKEMRAEIENLEQKLAEIAQIMENPNSIDEIQEDQKDHSEEPRLSMSPIQTEIKEKIHINDSVASLPALKKIKSIQRNIFLQPIFHDYRKLRNLGVRSYTSTKLGERPMQSIFEEENMELPRFNRLVSKSMRPMHVGTTANQKLGDLLSVEQLDLILSTRRLSRDMSSNLKSVPEHKKTPSIQINPVVLEDDDVAIDDCYIPDEKPPIEDSFTKYNMFSDSPRRELRFSNGVVEYQDTIKTERLELDEIAIFGNKHLTDSIKVPKKEYLMMKDRLSKMQGGLDEVMKDTHHLLEIIDEMHKETKHNELKQKRNEELEYMKLMTSHNVPHSRSIVFIGHKNWNLALNMMIGLQMTVKSVMSFHDYELQPKDFKLRQYFQLIPKQMGSGSKFKLCTFFDYAPHVFNEIRKLYGIKNEAYIQSIGPESMMNNWINGNITGLSELISSGKSGSLFYYTADGQYIIKTVRKAEFFFLRKILKNYYDHLTQNPQSLIVKFFGCHKMKFQKEGSSRQFNKSYILVMGNAFNTINEIHSRFDLKGSTYKRRVRSDDHDNPSVAKKDLDFIDMKEKLHIAKTPADVLLDQLSKDTAFFVQNNIIDYSLLIGIHDLTKKKDIISDQVGKSSPILEKNQEKFKEWLTTQEESHKGGIVSMDGKKIYYFGTIDILTEFNTKKKLEYGLRSIIHGSGISAVPSRRYARRFLDFIKASIDTSIS